MISKPIANFPHDNRFGTTPFDLMDWVSSSSRASSTLVRGPEGVGHQAIDVNVGGRLCGALAHPESARSVLCREQDVFPWHHRDDCFAVLLNVRGYIDAHKWPVRRSAAGLHVQSQHAAGAARNTSRRTG